MRQAWSIVVAVSVVAACGNARRDEPRLGPTGDTGAIAATTPLDGSPAMTAPASTSHALTPRDALLAWLGSQGGDRDIGSAPSLRLPVTITFDADRLTLTDTRLGGADGIVVRLDDAALGISLKDRVRQKCPADRPSCRIWIEGTWRGLDGDVGQVAVTKFAGVIPDGDPAGERVELRAP